MCRFLVSTYSLLFIYLDVVRLVHELSRIFVYYGGVDTITGSNNHYRASRWNPLCASRTISSDRYGILVVRTNIIISITWWNWILYTTATEENQRRFSLIYKYIFIGNNFYHESLIKNLSRACVISRICVGYDACMTSVSPW